MRMCLTICSGPTSLTADSGTGTPMRYIHAPSISSARMGPGAMSCAQIASGVASMSRVRVTTLMSFGSGRPCSTPPSSMGSVTTLYIACFGQLVRRQTAPIRSPATAP